jgi:pimeloyl-ACP methyl ester carboxylesterase
MKPTIILVHGAFAESSSWDRVIEALVDAGHPVIAAANPLRGVASDAAAVADVVRAVDGPVVLAGHSNGATERQTSTSLRTASTTSSARTSPRRRPQ